MKKNLLLTIGYLFIALSASAQSDNLRLYGTLVNGGESNLPTGIYLMPTTSDGFAIEAVKTSSAINATHGATIVDRELHFISEDNDGTLYYNRYDTNTWEQIGEPTEIEGDFITADLLYDEVDEVMYGCFWGKNTTNENPDRLSYSLIGRADKGSFEWDLMTEMAAIEDVMALGMNVNGVLFAVGTMGGMWHIDQTNGITVYTMMTPQYNYMIKKDTQYALCFDPTEPYTAYLLCTMRGQDDGTWCNETILWRLEPQLRQRTLIGTLPKGVEFSALWFSADDAAGIEEIHRTEKQNHTSYNLNGQRIEGNWRGIQIVDGKKILKR